LILISGIFYLYPEAPDVAGFIGLQDSQAVILSTTSLPKQQAYLTITEEATQRVQEYFFSQ